MVHEIGALLKLGSAALVVVLVGACAGPGLEAPARPAGQAAPGGGRITPDATESVPAKKEQFVVIIGGTGATHGMTFYTQEFGLYEKYGLEAEIQRIGGGGPAAAALLSGQADVSSSSGAALAESRLQGSDIVYIGNLGPKGDDYVMTRPEITSVEQLRGKKAAVPSFGGGFFAIMTTFVLPKYGLDKGPDAVTLMAAGDTPTALQGVLSGQFDMALASFDQHLRFKKEGLKVLLTPDDLNYRWFNGFAASQVRVSERRPAFLRFLKAQIETISIIRREPQRTIAALKKWFRSEDEGLMAEYQEYLVRRVPLLPKVDPADIVSVLLTSENPAGKTADPKAFIDNSPLEELERSGFVKQFE